MGNSQMNKAAKKMRQWKRLSLPLGFILIAVGWIIITNWGTSWRVSQVDWYTVHSEEINAVGIAGILILITGIIFLVIWFLLWLILKVTISCPNCKGLLEQRTSICPHCKIKLDWGNANVKMRYCGSCGTKAQDGHAYCRGCGRKLTEL